MIVYELTTSLPPPSQLALAPFELYREPLIILAIADGSELDHVSHKDDNGKEMNGYDVQEHIRQLRALDQELESVRDQHPKALVHQALLFDYHHESTSPELPEGLVSVPSSEKSKITTMKTIMCDLSSLFLAELTAMARSFQGMSTIESPGVHLGKRASESYSWENGSPRPMSQYDSQSIDSRTGSPVPIPKADKSAIRMSMPVRFGQQHGEHTRSASSGSRPSTPQSSSGTTGQEFENNKSPPPLRRGDGVGSPERVSVQGFGSGSLSERARTRGKGRVSIAIGGLYLQAGRCQDAIRELSEGAYIAKSNNDHLWHAKALEGMLVSMLMLAWACLDFTVPTLCYSSGTGPYQAPTTNNAEQSGISNRLASLRNLSLLLPELLDRILALYERAANFAGESLPQLPFSETVIRYAKLLSTVHMCDGILNDSGLQLLVMGRPSSPMPNRHVPRLNITPARSDIVQTLFRAFPQPSATALLTVTDRTIILAGIASVLGVLGYDRKKGMIVRELISVLIPGLVQARMAGAAEMGIHPAAGLAALSTLNGNRNGAGALDLGEGDVESGVDNLLALLGRTYGVVSFQPSLLDGNKKTDKKVDDSDEAVVARILDNAASRQFGGTAMKMNVLRACINLAEALPDFEGVLRFSADLLRTAGTGVAPGPYTDDAGPMMEREEQVRLSSNIARTVDAAKKIGLNDLKAEYWDEFLIRGVELDALPASKAPTVHQSSVLASSVSGAETSKNPFIYNPFAKKKDAVVERVLVAGESAIFKVTLQNPYEFDIYIDRIRLQADNDDFVGDVQKTVIGPYRNQILSVSGTPKSAGSFKITGCIVKIRGCRERRFPIFSEAWAPQSDIKIKAIGLGVQRFRSKRPSLDEKAGKKAKSSIHAPKPTNLQLTSIGHQPVLQILSTSLSQLACMVLEGERQTFTITLKNLSKTTAVDLLLFSFQDSTQAAVQHVLSSRDASPAELYEYELILAQRPALKYIKDEGETETFIEPNGTKVCKFEILGKPGLTDASVLVDYAHLGQPMGEVKDKFYTRQVSLPITVTVNASVELARLDVLPFSGTVCTKLWPSASGKAPVVEDKKEMGVEEDGHVLITLDLRNAWPSPLKIHLELPNERTIEEDILPGTISRVVFPHKRIFLSDPHKPIPVLDPARQRQFVVSTARGGAEGEKVLREAFWYREELLKNIKATWSSTSSSWGTKRSGSVDLRGFRMVPRLIEALRVEDVSITLRTEKPISNSHGKAVVEVDEFMAIIATIRNRSDRPIYPLLRLQPSLCHHGFSHALDLSKKLLFTGVFQRSLPILVPNSSTEVKLIATPLCRGEYEVSACVEEAKLTQDGKERMSRGQYGDGKRVGRERAGTVEIREMDRNLGGRERRVWYVREGLVVVVRDGDSDSEEDD